MNRIFKKTLFLLPLFLSQITLNTDIVNANFFKKLKLHNPLSTPKYHLPFEIKTCEKNSDKMRDQKLYEYAGILSNKLHIKTPVIFIFYAKKPTLEYNAFATYLKNNKPIVAFGNLLTKRWQEGWFTDQEIEAILAHELCHIKYRHMIKSGVLNLILTGPSLISRITVPTPSPKDLVKHAYSRKQEREADERAIAILDDPLNLLTALIKLQCLNSKTSNTKEDFDYNCEVTIDDIVGEKENFISPLIELLSTHPLTSTRMAYITKHTQPKS
ncbi:MAG: M48 family metalloprotease [bacterium]